MAGLVTTWPGSNGGGAPMSAVMAAAGRTPMFDGDNGPRYTGPFNAGGGYGSMLSLLMPQVMQMMMGGSHMPAQFFPEQNLYDQMEANKYMEASQSAMQAASRQDTRTVENMLAGVTQMMTKQPLTDLQRARNYRIAGGISSFMPLLSQVLGPDLIDQLHGSRGSATVFAQQMHHALRTSIDPISHTAGYSGGAAGQVTQETFARLFGPDADIGMLKGMSAGQAGILVNELQSLGLLGQPLGMMPLHEQRTRLPQQLSPDTVNRLAEQLPEIKQILDAGGTPNDDMLSKARTAIRHTHSQLIDPTIDLKQSDITQMPGAQEIIQTGDAARIGDRLKNLSGAVKAMRDIFGDMGNPNAPMREIINGLEALTQGGLSTMSAGELEMMVRKTHTIAKQTGIGVEGMMALTTQNAGLADQLGLDRTFAVTAAQQSATFGAAAGDNLRLDVPAWGALTKEQLLLNDSQLRMHAAASPLANQLNAVMRMADTGMAAPAADTELAAIIAAIRGGQTEYAYNGKKRTVVMPHAQIMQILQRDAGLNETESYAVLSDIKGNQEFGQLHNTTDTVRRIQTTDTANRMLTPILGNRLRGMLTDSGIDQSLQASGITANDTEFRELMDRIGAGVGKDFLALDPATVRSTPLKRQALGEAFKKRLTNEVRAKMPDASNAEVTAIVTGVIDQLGGEKGMADMGTALHATINTAASSHQAFRSDIGLHNTLHIPTMDQAAARDRQAEIAALNQSAMAGLGTADPIRRLSDVFQNATAETTLQDAMAEAMGGVSMDAIKAADPNGGLAKVFGLIKENNSLDANDPLQLEQARRNASIMRGLIEGGSVAKEQLRILDESRKRIGTDDLAPAELDRRKLRDAEFNKRQSLLRDTSRQLHDVRAAAPSRSSNALVTRAVRKAITDELGDAEIEIGDGRIVTSQGIVTRNADGSEKTIAWYSDIETARTALDALQQQARSPDTAAKANIPNVVKAMVATLGDREIPTGDGRFVSNRGVITRDAAGNELKVVGFTDLEAASTAMTTLRNYAPLPARTVEEKNKVTTSVRELAAALGNEEIDIGDGRFVTRQGVITKNAAGDIQTVTGFENMDASQAALDALQQRHARIVEEERQKDRLISGKTALATATPAQRAAAVASLNGLELAQRKKRDDQYARQQTRLTETATRFSRLAAGDLPAADALRERQLAIHTVRDMAANLGREEIALGGGRFVTKTGIVTKNSRGIVQSREGFDDPNVAREAFAAFQRRHAAAVADAAKADKAAALEPIEQRLGRASELGLLRGELGIGNETAYQQLQRAAARGSDTGLLGDSGYQFLAKVSIDQVRATHDSGKLAEKLLREEAHTAETASAVSTFVLGSHERGRQLLDDERSMNIIGQGGTELIRGAMKGSAALQTMAEEQSKKLGRKVELVELLRGGKGISDDVKQRANAVFTENISKWAEIDKLRGYGMLPGKGDDPQNKKRLPMTPQEHEDLAAQQTFMKEFDSPEARAAAVLDMMTKIATPEQSARLRVDTNRDALISAIAQGDRGVAMHEAVRSRSELLEMGLRKGVFDSKKTKLSDLTDDDEASVIEKLGALNLDETEKADFQRLRRIASPLMDFGMQGMKAGDITHDALRRIQQFSPSQAPPVKDSQDKPLKVTVTGTVTQRNDGLMDLSLEGRGIMDQVANTLGMV